jgi:hypothetical protein
MSGSAVTGIAVAGAAVVVVAANIVMRRKGYSIPGRTVVRCSKGHLFRTTWIEGASFKAVRLGPTRRFRYCPPGKHWAIIRPVREHDLTDEDQRALQELR